MSENLFSRFSVKKKKKSLFDEIMNEEEKPETGLDNLFFSVAQSKRREAFETTREEEPNLFQQFAPKQQMQVLPQTPSFLAQNPVLKHGVAQVTGLLDFISTPLNMSIKFFDTTADEGGGIFDLLGYALNPIGTVVSGQTKKAVETSVNFIKAIPNAVVESFKQLPAGAAFGSPILTAIATEQKTDPGRLISNITGIPISDINRSTYSDYIREHHSTFAKQFPVATSMLGFVADIGLDPVTYLSLGTSTVMKAAGKKLSNKGIDLIRELNNVASEGFRVTVKQKNGLQHTLDFGINEVEALRNVKNFSAIQAGVDGDAQALKRFSWAIQPYLKKKGQVIEVSRLDYLSKKISVEDSFIKAANADPKLLMEGGDLGVFLTVPFSPKRVTLVKPETVDKIFDTLGINKVRKAIREDLKESPLMALNRDMPLEEFPMYLRERGILEGRNNRADHMMHSSLRDIFGGLKTEERKGLTNLAIDMEKQISQYQVSLARINITISDKTIHKVRSDIMNDAFSNGKINQKQFDAMAKFIEAHNEFANIAITSQLYKQAVKTAKPFFFTKQTIGKKGAESIEQLIASNKASDMDLAVLYAMKFKNSMYKKNHHDFQEAVKEIFSVKLPNGKTKVEIPKQVRKDLQLVGNTTFSERVQVGKAMRALNKGNEIFKYLAYVIKPASAFKQYQGNMLQEMTVLGAHSFKALDPRNLIETALILMDNSHYNKYIPDKLVESITKWGTPQGKLIMAVNRMKPELLGDAAIVNRLGDTIPLRQLYDEVIDQDIFHKGLNVLDIDQMRDIKLSVAKTMGPMAFQGEKVKQGFYTFLKETLPWANWTSYVEQMHNVFAFTQLRKMGYYAPQSKELTQKALFKYAHGLTEFERKRLRALIPFYSFQRFAVPLGLSLLKEPGKATMIGKTMGQFFEMYNLLSSGESLTESQREILPGFLIEQPWVYDGTTQEGGRLKGVFRTFNSFNFTDWMSLAQFKPDGSVDLQQTVLKMSLAQITPFLKIPVEWAVGKDFFTGLAIEQQGRVAGPGNVDKLNYYMNQVEKNVPDIVKDWIGWEVRVDKITGERKGYVNPYLTHTMFGFAPFLREYVNIMRDDNTPYDFALKFVAGIGTVKLDFQKEQIGRVKELEKEIRDLQREIREDYWAGNKEVVNEDHAMLQELLKKVSRQRELSKLKVTP